jgi:hypothetical protein
VFTIAIVAFAASFRAGRRIQDQKSRICAAIGARWSASEFLRARLHPVARFPLCHLRDHRKSATGSVYATPRPSPRSGFPDKRGLVIAA